MAKNPKYREIMTAKSNITGETVNRFSHLHQSTEDLKNKVKMQRLMGQKNMLMLSEMRGDGCF